MSPEILSGEAYSATTDIFSFGVLLWELCTQRMPYKEFDSPWKVTQFVIAGSRLLLPAETPQDISTLVSACWAHQPSQRPKLSHVISTLQSHLRAIAKRT